MEKISTIGLDIAKRVFQIHAIDSKGDVVVKKQVSRSQLLDWFSKTGPCLVGIEACATSIYWAREIGKFGHKVKLIPPSYVKPYVHRQKNDRADAAAICEAVSRPHMRSVTPKTEEQQAIQVLHRTRNLLMNQRIQMINALRAHLAEFGVIFPLGDTGVTQAIRYVLENNDQDVPGIARQALFSLTDQIEYVKQEIAKLNKQMARWHRDNRDSQRLATIPGVGTQTATAIVGAIGDGRQFKSGRDFAAWLGLVPNQNSSGGKERLGGITKKGNPYLRRLLIVGATSLLVHPYRKKAVGGAWFSTLLERKAPRVATVALANKMARVAWAILVKGGVYETRLSTGVVAA